MSPAQRGYSLERSLAELLGSGYRQAEHETGFDFESRNLPHRIIEVKVALQSLRDVHAAIVRLAIAATQRPRVKATLIAWIPTIRAERLSAEWAAACSTFRPSVANRLSLVAITADDDLAVPDNDHELRRLLAFTREALRDEPQRDETPTAGAWSQRSYGIWRVLFDAWLRGEAPLASQEIGRRAGASQPVVRLAVERLRAMGELERSQSRRVSFRGVPRRSLAELAVLADRFRRTSSFVDATGRPPEPQALLRRIERHAPPEVAFGGVTAARHYHRELDLNGLPRIDLTIPGVAPTAWIERVDPALRPGRPGAAGAVIVIHRNLEADPRFEPGANLDHQFTGPAEVVLDLLDLRLTDQADALIHHLRAS